MKLPASTAVLAGALAALLAQATPSQSSLPPADPALRARFGFTGPLVHKVGDGINLLTVADLDGNPGDEILVHHGRRGRIEVLRLADGSITTESEATSTDVHGMAVGDFDADGTPDLAMVRARGRLEIQLRGKDAPRVPDIDIGIGQIFGCLRLGDLDGDGRPDAVVLTRDGIRTATTLATRAQVSEPVAIQEGRVRSFDLLDLDGDGHLDVTVVTTNSNYGVRTMLGRGDGTFGPWILLESPRVMTAFDAAANGKGTRLAIVEGSHRRLVEYALHKSDDAQRSALHLTPVPPRKGSSDTPFAHGDVDGDGDLDLVLADGDRAELTFLLEAGGGFVTSTAASLAGISSLAIGDLDGDGRNDLAMASPDEEALSWKSGARPLDAFPERIPCEDIPATVAITDGALWWIARDKKRNATLYRAMWQDGALGPAAKLAKLGRMSGAPVRMLIADLHESAGLEVAYVAGGTGLQILLPNEDGTLRVAETGAGSGFTKKMSDGALSLVANQSGAALQVVRDRFTRTFRLTESGEPVILSQDNGPPGTEELTLGATMPDGTQLLLDEKQNKLHRQRPGHAPQSVDVPTAGTTHLLAHHDAALLLTPSGVVRVRFRDAHELRAMHTFEPPTDKTNFWKGLAADFDNDGTAELALLDEQLHGLHLVVRTDAGLERAVSFPVFELPEALDDVYEPREIAAGDVDGDGRTDLILIAHDRVLIYPQEK